MAAQPRRAASPYARRLARERGISLAALRGSGPLGRIVATDVVSHGPASTASAPVGQPSALATTVSLAELKAVMAGFTNAGNNFELEDFALRAAGCALDDMPELSVLAGTPVALELGRRQLIFTDIRKASLGPLRTRRLAAQAGENDQATEPAVLSLRILPVSDIRPVLMPLLPGRALRIVLAAQTDADAGECLLSSSPAEVDEEQAALFLARFKSYLEVPLRMLA